ncbi:MULTISPECIES: hypothetical protein [Rhodococcus]|uniref:hypothetical protein n=1 Tax=Rhodococcus TaxID=1827 RepID=UPI00101F2E38|nr:MULTISPECIES: hypothetical protein [Rhodococcus]UTT48491.1 hypothetical protein NMQ04_20085 [Rhodococcus gordoniae]
MLSDSVLGAVGADIPGPGLYRVREVWQVLWSIPGAAPVVVWLSNPYVLGAITLAAAARVLWAFWPRRDESAPHTDTDSPEPRS